MKGIAAKRFTDKLSKNTEKRTMLAWWKQSNEATG